MNKIRKYLGFPADLTYRNQIEQNLTRHTFKIHTVFQLLILGCQILSFILYQRFPEALLLSREEPLIDHEAVPAVQPNRACLYSYDLFLGHCSNTE